MIVESLTDSFSFARELRLLSKSDFSQVFDQPTRVGNRAFTVLFRSNLQNHPRLGLAIAKKQVRLAVDRNRIKRLIRECFRQQQHQLPNIDLVFMVRRDINQLDNAKIQSAIQHIWKQVAKKCAR
ncbi:ribonuclease P protein component [Pleionea litopenaei]|uniref:ribonuclease P protein component n=1 Tax=Pleionea litopenaei TaxID=3070815 RepID=UPI00338ED0E4